MVPFKPSAAIFIFGEYRLRFCATTVMVGDFVPERPPLDDCSIIAFPSYTVMVGGKEKGKCTRDAIF